VEPAPTVTTALRILTHPEARAKWSTQRQRVTKPKGTVADDGMEGDDPPAAETPANAGAGAPGGNAGNLCGTPVALNDADASQASKELQQLSGADLAAMLQKLKEGNLPASHGGASNIFARPRRRRRKRANTNGSSE
jgi:hypothetical protein